MDAEPDLGRRSPISRRARHLTRGCAGDLTPDGARRQPRRNWDATAVLLEARDAIQATAARLPYVGGF
jgi:hypothetical protein